MDAIEIKDVTKTFMEGERKTKALDKVSFTVKKGEIVGLLGANGAGKTTLISILCGLLTKDKGIVKIAGMDLDTNLEKIKPRINIVSGFTMVAINLTVKEYLTYFAMLYSSRKDINGLIDKFGLGSHADTVIRDLSSGYKQRVLLAKSLVNDPEIMFMDEPTVGLDVGMARKIRIIIEKLKEKGTTILFTSHNLNEVEQLCDRIVLISGGKIRHIGTVAEIKGKTKNKKAIEVVTREAKQLTQEIKGYKEISKIKQVGEKIIIETKEQKDAGMLIRKIVALDHEIISIRQIGPNLEEAFLEITGE
ncbi:MAG: ABC transporter ATP-binding protein [Candidatus Woesearchaeota archaeon]